jgi:phosphatidyl-myo-inositol alpha-mannosyltransferase
VQVGELARRLRDRDHDVLVLAPSRSAPVEPWVHGVGRPIDVPYNASVAPICPWPSSRKRVRSALERFDPEVVHAHEPLTPSTSMFATRWGGAPVVATFHSGAGRARLFDVAAPALRRVAAGIEIRVAVSRAAAAFAGRRIGGGFVVVPNGVDLDRFRDASPAELPPGRRILFVGRLDKRKGFPDAVRAFDRVASRVPEALLLVVGTGPDAAALDELGPDTRRRVVLLGAVPNEDLHHVEASCEVLMAPSIGGESFGIVLVEALAAGLPVVASNIPGYDEVIRDGDDGLLVPPQDPATLASAVRRVLRDPDLADRLARAGRRRAERYSWDVVTTQLEVLYRRAMG